jgi:hypothetical protein
MTTVERGEIYVRPASDPLSNRFRITTAGGREPIWSRDGKTLYFRRNTLVFAVDTSARDPSRWGAPRRLFDRPYHMLQGPTTYDAAPDGRLLMLKESREPSQRRGAEVRMIQHWTGELRRLLPAR